MLTWGITGNKFNPMELIMRSFLFSLFLTFSTVGYAGFANTLVVSPPIIMPGELKKIQETVLPPPAPVVLKSNSK